MGLGLGKRWDEGHLPIILQVQKSARFARLIFLIELRQAKVVHADPC